MACFSGALQRMLMNLGHKKTQRLNWVLLNSAGLLLGGRPLQSVKCNGIRLTDVFILVVSKSFCQTLFNKHSLIERV
jgi:hypothetical protein